MPPPEPADQPMPDANDLSPLLEEATRLGIAISSEQRAVFSTYLDLLVEWNERAGLTTVDDPAEAQRRHFGESIALLALLRDEGLLAEGRPTRVADLGPGGGFPGVPMRIMHPSMELVLIESNQRRAEFLGVLVERLGLGAGHAGVSVVPLRAEDAGRDPALRATFDLVVARALAAMPVLVEYALPLLREGGVLVAPKGSRALEELAAAAGAIGALGGTALEPRPLAIAPGTPSQTVLLVRRAGPLDDRYPRRAGIPSKRPLA